MVGEEVVEAQVNTLFAGQRQQGLDMVLRNAAIGPASGASALPIGYAGAVNTYGGGNGGGATKLLDDCLSRLHCAYCSDMRYECKPLVAKPTTD